ncbi:tether containing UBX domain for GLUT4 [Helicoverpa armigera]|uniref:tether containing UBX domain for GLUT4 n=1 Tax=Helicoverpa armigera TaxID=29058 RepID=UPI00308329E6
MSKDIIVLAPNGRRQKVHCTPDTSILQVLEDVCHKQGLQPSDYDLKHHNHILDLTTTVRFSNLPNKAMLEMVEADKKRQESNVTIGLQLEDGERRTADFAPNTALYDLIISLAPGELNSLDQPTILYMRQEVVGEPALKEKTLRQLGLIKGRAILRLLNKQAEARQANVSAFYRCPVPDSKVSDGRIENIEDNPVSGPSNINKQDPHPARQPDILAKYKESTIQQKKNAESKAIEHVESPPPEQKTPAKEELMEVDNQQSNTSINSQTREHFERRLKIEEEVTFLGAQKAIAFTQPDFMEEEIDDLPDDFYELSIEEVRKLYHDLQQNRITLENTPLLTSSKQKEFEEQASIQKLNLYKNVVVRVQFPDHIILQGIFTPTNTIEDVTNFIKEHLRNPNKQFHIFVTPLKETLQPKMTLLDAKFVPCVHMHFKWIEEDKMKQPYLKDEIYQKKTASDAASILASKYRAPSRRKAEETHQNSHKTPAASTSKSSRLPKWFKN